MNVIVDVGVDNGDDTVPNSRVNDDVGVNVVLDVGVNNGADTVPDSGGLDDVGVNAGVDVGVDDGANTVLDGGTDFRPDGDDNADVDDSSVCLCISRCIFLRVFVGAPFSGN